MKRIAGFNLAKPNKDSAQMSLFQVKWQRVKSLKDDQVLSRTGKIWVSPFMPDTQFSLFFDLDVYGLDVSDLEDITPNTCHKIVIQQWFITNVAIQFAMPKMS